MCPWLSLSSLPSVLSAGAYHVIIDQDLEVISLGAKYLMLMGFAQIPLEMGPG
jgi:hypothetical protein